MDHISLSRWSDLILIAPATANAISKLSYGMADDLASTLVLASNKKVFISSSNECSNVATYFKSRKYK